MRIVKKALSLMLTFCMVLSLAVNITAAEPAAKSGTSDELLKIVHLDAGRKYFDVDSIKEIIDTMSESGYNALELAVGNDGMRFLLDDMRLIVGDQIYSSKDVKAAIQKGNREYANFETNELTESEMDVIIQYAAYKGISIIPLINTPGHMDAIIQAMNALDINDASYYGSARTLNIVNEAAVEFTQQLIKKYADYFSEKGSTIFNIGCDEFANDIYSSQEGMGFGVLQEKGHYDVYIEYVNEIARIVKDSGMTPMAFNDGFYYGGVTDEGSFDTDIMIAYWTTGWGSNYLGVQSAASLSEKGHKIINTNSAWYYVLGATSGSFPLSHANYGVANTKYDDVPGENDPAITGSMICFWCDDPDVEYSQYRTNVNSLIQTFAENNPELFENSLDSDLIEKTITIVEGETAEDIIRNHDYTEDVNDDELDETIASVEVEYFGTPGETEVNKVEPTSRLQDGQYLIENDRAKKVLTDTPNEGGLLLDGSIEAPDSSDLWEITYVPPYDPDNNMNNYYVQNSEGQYLTIGDDSATLTSTPTTVTIAGADGTWTIFERETIIFNWDYYLNHFGGGDSVTAKGWLDRSASSDEGSQWNIYTLSANGTRVEFTGNQVGTTSVTIGNVHYTINVVPKDLSDVADLNINLFISTSPVWAIDDETHNSDIKLSAADAYSEEGVNIADLVPAVGWWQWASNETQTVFWKGTVLPDGLHQTNDVTNDRSMSGTDYTHLRYWNDQWEYSSDGNTWTKIKETDEIDAYYLQKTTVTNEVDTYVKDWAFTTSNSQNQSGDVYQKALSFAVVYPNGNMNPATEEGIYADSTLIYWENLANLGFIRIGVNEVYEVEKITYTMGERADSDSQSNWGTSDSINWEKRQVDANTKWYDETTCWDESYGTEPVINGQDLEDEIYAGNQNWQGRYNGTWGFNDAVLILIYLKPVESEDSLTVRYWDDDSNSLIYDYPINVTNVSTEDPGTFLNRLQQENKPVNPGEFILEDSAYIINAKGEPETFQKDLTQIPPLFGKYTSGLYQYTKAEISEDGKTLTLHYDLDESKLSASYVVDFGLPLTIPMSDIVENTDHIESLSIANIIYGTSTTNGTESITYTPSKVLNSTETIGVTITYDDGEIMTHSILIIPATTVYYEEGFASYSGDWSSVSTGNGQQQASKPGAADAMQYGFDKKYADEANGPSNSTKAESSTYGDSAELTFTGTGIDIYTNSTPDSGRLFITVTNSKGSIVKLIQVETALKEGTTPSTSGQNVEGYNVPVASLDLGERDTYTVKLSHMKTTAEDEKDMVSIDGYRVYDTLEDNEAYYLDGENDPTYVELRDQVLLASDVNVKNSQYADEIAKNTISQVYSKTGTTEGAVLLSADENVGDAQDILDNGPKNELYLHPGQSVVFKVSEANKGNVQIGLKALNQLVKYTINRETKDLSSSTDMFYQLDVQEGEEKIFIITNNNTDEGILAITKIKFPGTKTGENDTEISMFSALNAEDLIPALNDLGIENRPVEADAEAQINLTDYTGKVVASTTLSSTGEEGNEALFSAEDIQSAAEKVLPEHYAFVDENDFEDLNVKFGEKAEVNVQVGKVATLNVTYKTLFGHTKGKLTLTAVQTSSASSYKFSASDLRKAAPDNLYWTGTLIGSTVKYGETKDRTVIGLGI
mgnify:FL=1